MGRNFCSHNRSLYLLWDATFVVTTTPASRIGKGMTNG